MGHLLFSIDTNDSKKLSRLSQKNEIRRLSHGIYTDNLSDPIEKIALSNWMQITAYLVTGGILSYRTAMDLKPIPYKDGPSLVFVTSTYNKTITLPGFTIKVLKGNHDDFIEQILPNLARSNVPRMLLENLSMVKNSEYKGIKTREEKGVEEYLAKELQERHEKSLNAIRDEARIIAQALDYHAEFKKLNHIIAALLSTHTHGHILKSYDTNRLKLFENLYLHLKNEPSKDRSYIYSKLSFKNLSFFESYFSNFIEGTEFIIEEAEDIVFQGHEIQNRHADSHDILANFNLTNDFTEMGHTPKDETDFLNQLKNRHAYLMKERPNKHPGEFKTQRNKAGSSYFVLPEEVVGTLIQSFEYYQYLPEGLPRALYIHFVVSEVHPFNDGNGRLSRIMMNAELVSADQYKILIPTVMRDNYLNGLRRATREHDFALYRKVMNQAQAYVQSIDWTDYASARNTIETDCADKIPDEGLPIFNRVLRKLH